MLKDDRYIAHFPGKGKCLMSMVEDYPIVKVDDRIQVVTFATPNLDKPLLIKQLEDSHIDYLNPVKDYTGEWSMMLKMDTVKDLKIDKPYTLMLDAVDTILLRDIPVFNTFGKVLYNSSSCLYPVNDDETPINGRYFNAGVAFGPTEALQEIYRRASCIGHKTTKSEQKHLRRFFNMTTWEYILIDYWEMFFLNTHYGEHKLKIIGKGDYELI